MIGVTRPSPQHLCSWQASLTTVVLSKSALDVFNTVLYDSGIVDDRGSCSQQEGFTTTVLLDATSM